MIIRAQGPAGVNCPRVQRRATFSASRSDSFYPAAVSLFARLRGSESQVSDRRVQSSRLLRSCSLLEKLIHRYQNH